jgi:hypothetical protein
MNIDDQLAAAFRMTPAILSWMIGAPAARQT